MFGLDIRCVRLTPYKVGERLLLDVQQLIPVPEARALMIQLKRRQAQVRAAESGDGRDWTQYVIVTPEASSEPLRKRRAILAMVMELHTAGVTAEQLARVVPHSKFLPVEGTLSGDGLAEAFVLAHPGQSHRLGGWFLDSPIHDSGKTWLLSKRWGTTTEQMLKRLVTLAPHDSGLRYEQVPAE